MGILVKCPNPACGKSFNLRPDLAGKTVRSDACQQAFKVPDAQPGNVGATPSGRLGQAQGPAPADTAGQDPPCHPLMFVSRWQ